MTRPTNLIGLSKKKRGKRIRGRTYDKRQDMDLMRVLMKKYTWLRTAIFKNALFVEDSGGLAFKSGIWLDGIWEDGAFEGIWVSGTWINGLWLGGYDKDGTYHKEAPNKWSKMQ